MKQLEKRSHSSTQTCISFGYMSEMNDTPMIIECKYVTMPSRPITVIARVPLQIEIMRLCYHRLTEKLGRLVYSSILRQKKFTQKV